MHGVQLTKDQIVFLLQILNDISIKGNLAKMHVGCAVALEKSLIEASQKKLPPLEKPEAE